MDRALEELGGQEELEDGVEMLQVAVSFLAQEEMGEMGEMGEMLIRVEMEGVQKDPT